MEILRNLLSYLWRNDYTGVSVIKCEDLADQGSFGSGSYSVIRKVHHNKLGTVVYKKIEVFESIDDNDDDDGDEEDDGDEDGDEKKTEQKTEEQKKEEKNKQRKKQFEHEFGIQKRLKHDNIIKLLGVILHPVESVGMLQEYIEYGDLRSVQQIYRHTICWQFRVKLLLDAASGIKYLHRLRRAVVHGDLKSENLLVTNNFMIKLCDFGSAAVQGINYGRRLPFTYNFVPPEAWKQGKKYKPHTTYDVYSFAVVMWEVLTGELSYGDQEAKMVEFHVKRGGRPLLDQLKACPEINDLIEQCWKQEPKERPCFKDIKIKLQSVLEKSEVKEWIDCCYQWLLDNPHGPEIRPYLSTPEIADYWLTPKSTDQFREYKCVNALSLLYSSVFVVFNGSPVIKVFNKTLEHIRDIRVEGLKYPTGITTCKTDKCLYISHFSDVLCVDSVSGLLVRWWKVSGRPVSININYKGHIILSFKDDYTIKEYTTTGELIQEIELTDTTDKLKEKLIQWRYCKDDWGRNVIKVKPKQRGFVSRFERKYMMNERLKQLEKVRRCEGNVTNGLLPVNNEYVISLKLYMYNEFDRTDNWFLCRLSSTGELLNCFPDPQQSEFNVLVTDPTQWEPRNCTVDDRQQLIVHDVGWEHNRILLFTDKSLFNCSQLIDFKQTSQQLNFIRRRFSVDKLYFDKSTGLLFVDCAYVLLSYRLM